MTEEKYTVTSALPYIHGVPHLGNIVGSILPADIYHRYLDLRGKDNVFICGSDVHGTPLELEAMEQGTPVEKLKTQNHRKVKEVLEAFKMDFSIYSDTHSDYNRKQTRKMFKELYCNGFIQEESYDMAFCLDDERFLPDRYIEGRCPHCGGLARGDQCDDCGKLLDPEEIVHPECQICGGSNIEFRETTHLAIDLQPFKEKLHQWLELEDSPVPESRKEQVRNLIDEAETRTITRDQDWGFDIPAREVNGKIEDENLDVPKLNPELYDNKVLYVWFDAPIGYIGFTRELFDDDDEWKDYWRSGETKTYYSIGKDNTIFHTVIWPSMLMGASDEDIKYALPYYEFIQEFLMAEDTQFSKSRGKGLSTEDALEMCPADYWRFYLARNIPEEHDSKFSWADFEAEVNNVLNDTVGNFVNRTLALAEKQFNGEVPVADLEYEDREAIKKAEKTVDEYVEAFENHSLKEAVEKAVELARIGDQYLSEEEPWNNPERQEAVIQTSIQLVRGLGCLMYPFTPEATEKIEKMLDVEIHTEEGYDELQDPLLGGVGAGEQLGEREVLFEKIDIEELTANLDKEEDNEKKESNTSSSEENENNTMNTVSFEQFDEMDIRTGEVKEVEEHPNADRLYLVQVDVGDRVLQSCAGLREHYEKEELEGRSVIVLVNLEPSKLRGETSECMMLAAENDEGEVSLLQTDREMEKGNVVK